MQKVIGVRFKPAGKIYLFDPGDYQVEKGDSVIVDTSQGLEYGEVVMGMHEIPQAENPEEPLPAPRKIHRKATRADLARIAENKRREQEAFEICQEKIHEYRLPMHLINARYTFDVTKVIFYFTSEVRVDFRVLVRDLAYIFRTRIELRQVGVREEAKLLGGVGCCGRKLCCTTFLGDFTQVSIRMAKEQNLSLNPTKISGICRRLLCCLKFESDYYHECYVKNNPIFEPQQNDRVILDEGEGRIVSINPSRRIATVLLDSKKTVVASWENLMPVENESFSRITQKEPTTDDFLDFADNTSSDAESSPEQTTTPPKENLSPKNKKIYSKKFSNRSDDKAVEKKESDDSKKPWIKRPRRPRRPHGNFR